MHQWVAIIDNSGSSEDVSAIAGYLKVSIQVTGEYDTPTDISEDVEEMDDGEETPILVPIQVTPNYLQLTLRIFEANSLPEFQSGGISFSQNKMDGYALIKRGNYILKSNVITQNGQKIIVWDAQFLFAV